MSFFLRGLGLILVLSLGVGAVPHGQTGARKPTPSPSDNPRSSKTEAENSSTEEERSRTVDQIRTFSDRIIKFRNLGDRTRGLIAIADLLWKDDKDYARQLLVKASDGLSAPASNGPQSAEYREVARLRAAALASIAKLDVDLAWRLSESWLEGEKARDVDPSSRSSAYLQTALSLAELKPEEALKFADESVKAGISQTTIAFLLKIKQADPRAARKFFLNLLTTAGRLESTNGNDLLLLGCYVFAAPAASQLGGVDAAGGITWALVGDLTVVNIAAREPALPLDQVQAYLRMAAATLKRPARSGKDRVFNYFAAYQLLPYVKQFLPAQTSDIELAMLAVKADVPPQWTQPGATSNLGVTRLPGPEDTFQQLENEPVSDRRDGLALSSCHSACLRGEFNQAEKLALLISDLGARAKVRTLVGFYRGAKLVEQGDLTPAVLAANNLGSGAECAILWLAIGRSYVDRGDKNGASEALLSSRQVARSLERPEAAAILTSVGGQYARFDVITGIEVFAEAVHAYNSIDVYKPFRWVQQVRVADRTVEFSLGGKGIERGFAPTIDRLASTDPDGAAAAVLKLSNERLLGEAIIALSGSLLRSRKMR